MTTTGKRINILVYSGEGTTTNSLQHVFFTFRRLLSPTYIVLPLSTSALLTEPWLQSCAALIMPGGADLPYCRALNGLGNQRIKQFVSNGGRYIGLCAGAYYGSARCEFMEGDALMEVMGDRELQFFPGICRGLAFKGFVYQNEKNAKAVKLQVNESALKGIMGPPKSLMSYYHGGGVFVDAEKFEEQGVEILASYSADVECNSGEGKAAIVYRKVGEGAILLTGTHPEFASSNLDKTLHGPEFKGTVEALEKDEEGRISFLRACLTKLGLEANHSSQLVPSPSPLQLTAWDLADLPDLLSKWKDIMVKTTENHVVIAGDNDIFNVEGLPEEVIPSPVTDTETIERKLESLNLLTFDSKNEVEDGNDRIIDYDKIVKHIYIHAETYPTIRETPKFNHQNFYLQLEKYAGSRIDKISFGKFLLYAEVITSTSTILEKNSALLRTLPTGFTATASTQISGRGRGSNVWVSPPGSLMFSTVIWHPMAISHSSPVVFIQYLAAMAVVRGAQTYARGYADIPLKLKWPNDVYARDPASSAAEPRYVKVGGILVNSSYSGQEYGLVVGVGVNVANAAPTTGLDMLARQAGLPVFESEKLLARVLTVFEELYRTFCRDGWERELEDLYYGMWLHTDQIVTLETEGGLRAKIRGITRDWGLLQAEELGWEDRPTGHVVSLQTDSNSFDFFRGLIKRKV